MKPVKSLRTLSYWLLRLAAASIIYVQFFHTFIDFKIKELSFLIAALYVIFAVLLFIGGFLSSARLTVVCGLIILILSIVKMFLAGISIYSIINNLTLASLGLYFLANGNKSS